MFCTIGKKLANNISLQSNEAFIIFLKKHTASSFFLEPPTVNEIVELICSLNVNKAVGHDNIPSFFLKTAPFVIANYLCVFVKFFFKNGIFPDACKIAKIVAIHKNGNKSNPSNYRPISTLVDFVETTVERISNRRLFISRLETGSFVFFSSQFNCSSNRPIRSICVTSFFLGSPVLRICRIESVKYA